MNRLCGRKPLVDRLRRAVFRDGRSIVLRGAPGVGKSSLVRHVIARPKHSHVVVRISTSPRGAKLRFGAFASHLGAAGPAASDAQTLNAISAALRHEADGARLVLVVDDVQFLDDPSAAAIDQMVRSGDVQLVAALPLAVHLDWIERLVRDELIGSDIVPPLSIDGTAELIEALLGASAAPDLVDEISRLSGGNPWRIKQLISVAQQRSALERFDGSWRAVGAIPIPDGLVSDAVEHINGLEAQVRATIDVIVVARELEMGLLELHDHGDSLEVLEGLGIVEVQETEGRLMVRLADPVLQDRLERDLPVTVRRSVSRELSSWVGETGQRRRGDALRTATWRFQGGRAVETPVMIRAVHEALEGRRPAHAARLLRVAVDHDGELDSRILLAECLLGSGAHDGAEKAALEAVESARTDIERARAARVRSRIEAHGRRDADAARRVLVSAARSIRRAAGRRLLEVEHAAMQLRSGSVDAAVRVLGGSTRSEFSPKALATPGAAPLAGELLLHLGRPAEVAELALEIGPAVVDLDGRFDRLSLDLHRAEAQLQLGELDTAEQAAEHAFETANSSRRAALVDVWRFVLGQVSSARGDLAAAADHLDASAAGLARFDPLALRPRVVAQRALVAARAGRAGTGSELLTIDLDGTDLVAELVARRAAAEADAARGEPQGAALGALETADIASAAANAWHTFQALFDVVRFGEPELVIDRLEVLSGGLEGPRLATQLAHARALAATSADELVAVADRYVGHGLSLRAAEAAADAARLVSSEADEASSRRWLARAQALAERCPGAATYPLRGRRPMLTKRQTEVARLAPFLSNNEISDRLSISTRTVENHLNTIFHTLGIHRRAELHDLFEGAFDDFE